MMRFWREKIAAGLGVIGLFLVLGGCGGGSGGGDSSSSDAKSPSAAEKSLAQLTAASMEALDEVTLATNDALTDAGAGEKVTVMSEGAPKAATISSTGWSFSGSHSGTVDLNAKDNEGNDRYPNSTGVLNYAATGIASGDGGNGNADYTVTVTTVSDVTYSDPASGASVTIASGSAWSYSLALSWGWTNASNWSISRVANLTVSNRTVTVNNASGTWTVTINGTRDVTATLAKTAGKLSFARDLQGNWTAHLSGPSGEHDVKVVVDTLRSITITVDGVVYGPYSALQWLLLFALTIG